MESFTTRILINDENQELKVNQKPQVEVKRTVLKQVGNKDQSKGEGSANLTKAPEKKQDTFPTTNFPIVKRTTNKPPSIKVKDTKSYLLRAQHSRLSVGKVPDKNTPPAAETVPKEPAFSTTLLDSSCHVDIDKEDENDPIMLGMYAKDLYKYLREMELEGEISNFPQYLTNSKLTGKMRATLIDWLVEVHRDFEMKSEALYLAVAIIDRFLEKNPRTRMNQLQLVGITAMFIACKYEERRFPDITALVYVSANECSQREILQMELKIVKSLDYSFGRPLPIHFLRRCGKADKVSPLKHVMAKYVMELGILEYDLCHIMPSLLAAAALYISLWVFECKSRWPVHLVKYSGYTLNDILPVVKRLSMLLVTASNMEFQSIRKKYSHPRNLEISVHPILQNLQGLLKEFK